MSIVVIGSYVQDYVWRVAALPALGESRIGEFSSGPGGKGFNQAVACTRLEVATLFVGALGRDAAADMARTVAAAVPLACAWTLSDAPTAAASVVLDAAGSNLICVALGANLALDAASVQTHKAAIQSAKVVLTQLETGLSATHAALTLAREANVLAVLNPAPINPGVTSELLALSDVLTPNETEFAFLLRHLHNTETPAQLSQATDAQLHAWCRMLTTTSVVITLGHEGAFVSHARYRMRGDAQFCYRVAALPARVVDTTGAGDAFNAGLCAGLVKFAAEPFQNAVHYATQVAALSVERAGAALAMPSAAEVTARWASFSAGESAASSAHPAQ
jgi:ribokinase